MHRLSIALLLAVALVACGDDGEPVVLPSPSGDARVDVAIAERHAAQFDDDLPDREAGSQQEFAAATYILGTLQQAGYVVRLESIPVEDLLKSTNVITQPPSGEIPRYLVVAGYDTPRGRTGSGASMGLFLELARALRVVEPEHDVGFVALGAESARVKGGAVGSRRLAQFLLDQEQSPRIVRIEVRGAGFKAYGPDADELNQIACGLAGDAPCSSTLEELVVDPDPLREAGFDHTIVVGDVETIAEVVLAFLEEHGR